VVVAVVWFANPLLGALFGAALLITLIFAGIAGAAIPIAFERLDSIRPSPRAYS
jgi:magnesium transporter